MPLTAKEEVGFLLINEQEAIPMITTSQELGHKKDVIPMKIDNSRVSNSILNKDIKQKQSQAFDTRF